MREDVRIDDGFVNNYVSLIHTNETHRDYVVVNWCLSNVCNYKCTYCPEGLHNGSVKWPEFETVVDFCEKVISHYNGRKIYFEFTGGEVTLWSELPRLISYLKQRDCRVGIISNGSRSEKYWKELIPTIDHVCLSFHPETGRTDHFFKIASLCAASIRTHINLMMHPDYFPQCLDLAYRVKDLKDISLAIQPLVVDFGEELYNYTEAQKKIIDTQNAFLASQISFEKNYDTYRGAMSMVSADGFKKTMSPQRFISGGKNSWKGWHCSAGVEQIVVEMSGGVYRGWCQVGGEIGKISDKKPNLPSQPIVCNKDFCHCNLDIMTTKTKMKPTLQDKIKNFVGRIFQ